MSLDLKEYDKYLISKNGEVYKELTGEIIAKTDKSTRLIHGKVFILIQTGGRLQIYEKSKRIKSKWVNTLVKELFE